MKKSEEKTKKSGKADFPDVKKIEKNIQTEGKKKVTEVPDNIPDEQASPGSPVEMPERNDENEIE
jgi:hypothetical protein